MALSTSSVRAGHSPGQGASGQPLHCLALLLLCLSSPVHVCLFLALVMNQLKGALKLPLALDVYGY